jgi:glycosyltransferase involved in cell wall biosynthesis
MRGYRVVTAVAEADAERLRRLDPRRRIEVVPNGVDVDYFRPQPDAAVDPDELVFVGVMSFPPNVAAMQHFTHRVLPLVRRARPAVRLTIVGRDPRPAVRRLAELDGVIVTGEVDDVRPYLARAAVVVVPMVSGSGIKNKVLEAMAAGKPVIGTSLAVEGLPVTSGQEVVVANGAEDIAAAVTSLLAAPDSQAAIGRAARALVEQRYTWDACAAEYDRLYRELATAGDRP